VAVTDELIIPTEADVAFEDGDDRGRILVFGRDTGGRYGLMEWTVAAGHQPAQGEPSFGPHLHRDVEETFLVRQGTLQFLLGDAVTTVTTGDFVRVPPGVRHGYANTSGAPVELLVSFHPGGLEELFLKYRTDGAQAVVGEGFMADAARLHASEFEDA
jgi:quercetin dioxygenase-like cupin family protein